MADMARPLCILNIPCFHAMLHNAQPWQVFPWNTSMLQHMLTTLLLLFSIWHIYFLTHIHWYLFVAMCCRTAHIILAFQMLLKKTNYCKLNFFEMPIKQCSKFLCCSKLSMHTCIFQQCVCRGSTLHISIYIDRFIFAAQISEARFL